MAAGPAIEGWTYRSPDQIDPHSLHIEVIADYGGRHHSPDAAFSEVRNHFFRFDELGLIARVTENAVQAFSTLETGGMIAQEALHSEHPNLVIFSNTAPRGEDVVGQDIPWEGSGEQSFVCALLDNGILVFAVNTGYNLSFIKDRIVGMWKVNVSNTDTQFRSRDQYPEAVMGILGGDTSWLGERLDIDSIPDVPKNRIWYIDGYGNMKTTIRVSELPDDIRDCPILRVTTNGVPHFVLNATGEEIHPLRRRGEEGDFCLVVGSSGGKNDPYVEIIRLQGQAADYFDLNGELVDDLPPILIESTDILYQFGASSSRGSRRVKAAKRVTRKRITR